MSKKVIVLDVPSTLDSEVLLGLLRDVLTGAADAPLVECTDDERDWLYDAASGARVESRE